MLVLAGLTPSPAGANDRDLRAITIPASACQASRDYPYPSDPLPHGDGFIVQSATTDLTIVSLRCPLPINNIDLSDTTDDNDVSKIRVHYRDSDGFGNNATVYVDFSHHRLGCQHRRVHDICRVPVGNPTRTARVQRPVL